MAQPSSVQREPSMEEILASIRRIIEDNDTEKRHDVENSVPTFSPAANDVQQSAAQADAFQIDFREEDFGSAMPADDMPADDMQVDDRQAAVAEMVQEPVQNERDAAAFAEVEAAARPAPSIETVASPAHSLNVELPDAPARQSLAEAPAREPVQQVPTPQPAGAAPVADVQGRAPLISDIAGRQVAAAFGELSDAFMASRRRSFDEMAEEMLRPMLQEWLDNNLPHLVERLVREEIERIARG